MRLFIAVELSDEMKKAAASALHDYKKSGARGNFVPLQNLHLTLAFIGETDARCIRKSLKSDRRRRAESAAFGSRLLGEYLGSENAMDPIDSITLIGLCTDICVISNALLIKAFLPEVPVAVEEKCCAGVTLESHRRALEAMQVCQIKIL